MLIAFVLGCPQAPPSQTQPKDATADPPAPKPPVPSASRPDNDHSWDFEGSPAGSMPSGFEALETNGVGTPATWGVVEDRSAPSITHAFGVLRSENSGQVYNLALVQGSQKYRNLDVSVSLRAISGAQDRGGGLVFRAKGPADYYVARWNPKESNVRFYIVQGQHRSALAKAEIKLDAKNWHVLRVLVEGSTFQLFVDDSPVLRMNNTDLDSAGRVGLWSKADAVTYFDDLQVSSLDG